MTQTRIGYKYLLILQGKHGEKYMVAITQKRNPEDILGQLLQIADEPRVFILGCGGCAALLNTGGEPEIKELSEKLSSRVTITGTSCILGVCIEEFTRAALHQHGDEIKRSHALIVLSCGGGVMAVRNSVDNIHVVSGLKTLGLGAYTSQDHLMRDLCQACGRTCAADSTGGLCALNLCPQGRIDGPCPENQDLSSETCVSTGENPCVWWEIDRVQKSSSGTATVSRPSLVGKMILPFLHLFPKRIGLFRRLLRPAAKGNHETSLDQQENHRYNEK